MRVSCTLVIMAVLLVLQSQCSPIGLSNNLLNLHLSKAEAVKDLKLAHTTDHAVTPLTGQGATPLLTDVTGLGILSKRNPESLLPMNAMSGLTQGVPAVSALSNSPTVGSVPNIGKLATISNAVPGIDGLTGMTGGLFGKRDITSSFSHLSLSSMFKPISDLFHKRELNLPMNGLGNLRQSIPMTGLSPLGGARSNAPQVSQLSSLPVVNGLASSVPLGQTFPLNI